MNDHPENKKEAMKKNIRRSLLALCGVGLWLSQAAAAYQNEIDQMARDLAEKARASNTTTIAVVDFTDLNGNVTELGRFFAEELSSALAEIGGLQVIDRIHLRAILQEHKLAATGVIDPATARKLGEFTGVQSLVTGTITEFGDSVRISAKVLDTATAQIHASVRSDIPKTDAIKELLGRGVETGGEHGTQSKVSPSEPPVMQSEQTQEIQEFSLQLTRCEVEGSDIVCHWMITNKNPNDRVIGLYYSCGTVLYDNLSREYLPSWWQLSASSSSSERSVEKTLLSGVPTPASIRFKLANTAGYQENHRSPDSITAVKVSILTNGCKNVTFRNIPLRPGN